MSRSALTIAMLAMLRVTSATAAPPGPASSSGEVLIGGVRASAPATFQFTAMMPRDGRTTPIHVTAVNGRFSVADLLPGNYWASDFTVGGATVELPGVLVLVPANVEGRAIEVRLPALIAPGELLVRDGAGEGVAGAALSIVELRAGVLPVFMAREMRSWHVVGRTDATGRVRFGWVPEGSRILVYHDGHAAEWVDSAALRTGPRSVGLSVGGTLRIHCDGGEPPEGMLVVRHASGARRVLAWTSGQLELDLLGCPQGGFDVALYAGPGWARTFARGTAEIGGPGAVVVALRGTEAADDRPRISFSLRARQECALHAASAVSLMRIDPKSLGGVARIDRVRLQWIPEDSGWRAVGKFAPVERGRYYLEILDLQWFQRVDAMQSHVHADAELPLLALVAVRVVQAGRVLPNPTAFLDRRVDSECAAGLSGPRQASAEELEFKPLFGAATGRPGTDGLHDDVCVVPGCYTVSAIVESGGPVKPRTVHLSAGAVSETIDLVAGP